MESKDYLTVIDTETEFNLFLSLALNRLYKDFSSVRENKVRHFAQIYVGGGREATGLFAAKLNHFQKYVRKKNFVLWSVFHSIVK